MSEEVYVLTVPLGYALNLGVRAAKHMFSPLVVVKRNHFDPFVKVFILSLNNPLLPLFVVADVIVRVKAIMSVMFRLLITLGRVARGGRRG